MIKIRLATVSCHRPGSRPGLPSQWPMRFGLRMAMLLTTAALLHGCGSEIGQGLLYPNVRVTYRQAIFDESLVVTITNAGAKPLFDVAVSCQRWESKYLISSNLRPGYTVEAGFLELPSGFESGDQVSIYAEGYPFPYIGHLP
jgi:hypothetical protein